MTNNFSKPVIISGSTHPQTAGEIARLLDCKLIVCEIIKFANGEIGSNISETVRGETVFFIQTSITNHVNDDLIETGLVIDSLKRAGADAVFLVQLLFPYERQDRRETNKNGRPKRRPISAQFVAKFYEDLCGVDGVISVHLHSEQIEGFFSHKCIVENISSARLFIEYLQKEGILHKGSNEDTVLASPDVGGAKFVSDIAETLDLNYVILDKRRSGPGQSKVIHIIGSVKDKTVIMIDDLIDSGGTAISGAERLLEEGAKDVYLVASHAVFSGDAVEKLLNSKFKKIIVTDTVPNSNLAEYPDKFVVLPIANLMADVIARIFDNQSLQDAVRHTAEK